MCAFMVMRSNSSEALKELIIELFTVKIFAFIALRDCHDGIPDSHVRKKGGGADINYDR
jgi:hypothetical protein